MSYGNGEIAMRQAVSQGQVPQTNRPSDVTAPTVSAAVARASMLNAKLADSLAVAGEILVRLRGEVPPMPEPGARGNEPSKRPPGALFELRYEQEVAIEQADRLNFLVRSVADTL